MLNKYVKYHNILLCTTEQGFAPKGEGYGGHYSTDLLRQMPSPLLAPFF